MTRKEWYNIKAPNLFKIREVGKTPVNRSQGTYIASDALKGRVFVANLGDLNEDEDQSHRKIRLLCEDVQGRDVLTSFQGMVFTTDKLKSLIKKWHTLIEANADIKTTDGYVLRLFCIGFSKKRPNQTSKTTYIQTSQIKQIRAKMIEVMEREVSGGDLKEFVTKLIPELIRKEIEKVCSTNSLRGSRSLLPGLAAMLFCIYFILFPVQSAHAALPRFSPGLLPCHATPQATRSIFPLQNVYIRKVKVLKRPKFDVGKLLDLHTSTFHQPFSFFFSFFLLLLFPFSPFPPRQSFL